LKANFCIFCEIAAGRSAASFVHRDETCVAFMDIRPVTPGHLLVIPIQHATYLADLAAEAGTSMFAVDHRLGGALRQSGLKVEGINLFLADGEQAGQEIFHVHMHVIPRFEGDGFGLRFPQGYGQLPPRDELDQQAELIRKQVR